MTMTTDLRNPSSSISIEPPTVHILGAGDFVRFLPPTDVTLPVGVCALQDGSDDALIREVDVSNGYRRSAFISEVAEWFDGRETVRFFYVVPALLGPNRRRVFLFLPEGFYREYVDIVSDDARVELDYFVEAATEEIPVSDSPRMREPVNERRFVAGKTTYKIAPAGKHEVEIPDEKVKTLYDDVRSVLTNEGAFVANYYKRKQRIDDTSTADRAHLTDVQLIVLASARAIAESSRTFETYTLECDDDDRRSKLAASIGELARTNSNLYLLASMIFDPEQLSERAEFEEVTT